MKTAIVTGSAGFIGGHLTDELLSLGYRVVGIDNMRSGLQSTMDLHVLNKNFIPKYYDIRDEKIESVFREYEPFFVFHLAAIPGVAPSVMEPLMSNDTNVNGTVNILNMSQKYGVKKVVFSSSSSVYGGAKNTPTKETCGLSPKSPYALQKKIGEEYCKLFSDVYGLDTVCLRYFNVFGPRQRADSAYAAVISAFCKSIKDGIRPTIYGDGEQSRDFCFIKNVISANILAATYKEELFGEAFNIGCGGSISVNSICETIGTMSPLYEEERPGDVRCSQADISKACDVFGYRPLCSYEDGMIETLKWHLDS